jgi:hypothetical protein
MTTFGMYGGKKFQDRLREELLNFGYNDTW